MLIGLIPLALILGLVGGLIAIQTDVSAAVTVFALGFLLFFMAGGSVIQIMLLLVISTGLGAGLVALRKPQVYQRIADFWVGIRDINTIGSEQIAKSFTAFVDGGWFGVGLGKGVAKLVLLRLGLLQADNIGTLTFKPIEKAFPGGSSNAVHVGGNDSHRE